MSSKIYSYQQMVSTAGSGLEQVVMLYDGAIKFLLLAVEDIKRKDMVAKGEHINRALAIIEYLQGILDMNQGGEVAVNLDRFYTIMTTELVSANAFLDEKGFERVIKSLRDLRSAWQHISAGPASRGSSAPNSKFGEFSTGLGPVRVTG